MAAAILIVGHEPVLLETRAELLKDWKVTTSASGKAVESIRSTVPDVLIVCHTIPDLDAETFIAIAREINPNVQALGLCLPDETRRLSAELYAVQLHDPGNLAKRRRSPSAIVRGAGRIWPAGLIAETVEGDPT
jgi:CheY-like chemotaxis protein